MEGRTERLSSLEKISNHLARPDLNIIVRTERSIRGPDDVMVRVPNETPFPDGFEVTFESIEPDGTCYGCGTSGATPMSEHPAMSWTFQPARPRLFENRA